jgi:glycosyltransferase involved in cell wall biosynthesis
LEGKVGVVAFQKEAHKVYQALDIVVHASTRPEPFGLVIAEALACAKPVVAALHGGAAEIGFDGEHCLGHIPGDPASLAGALVRLIRNDELRLRLGKSGRQRMVMDFSQSQIMTRWKSLLSKCGLPC